MHSSLASTEAAAQVGTAAAAEVNTAAAAAAIGEALRAVRESVRAAVLRRRDGSSGSSSSSSSDRKDNGCGSSCSSISRRKEVHASSFIRPAAHLGVRLVAVSKRQSAAAVAAAVAAGQRHFGENYVQELISKSEQLKHLNVSWHMIGHLQSNKAKQLLTACPRLYMVETVDSVRLAHILDAAVATVLPQREYKPLRVLVQVNTSGEESKSGLRVSTGERATKNSEKDGELPWEGQQQGEESQQQPCAHEQRWEGELGEIEAVVQCVVKECSHLQFAGLMTIGSTAVAGARQAFTTLGAIKRHLLASLPAVQALFEKPLQPYESLPPLRDTDVKDASKCSPLDDYAADEEEKIFELSMGMTSDFDEAIQAGSTEVRVGTAIFGQRC